MKAPDFWQRGGGGIFAMLLTPISWLYAAGDRINRSGRKAARIGVPVICVGNIVAGGAGKTPVAIALARFFLKEGKKPHFLSRGYGGRLTGPVRVVLDVHSYKDVGDEPLLLAETAPTWVAKDRAAGAKAAEEAGADVVIMDDGFQNPSLFKDFSLLVFDGGFGIGNGRLLPAGPLREPFAEGLDRADAVIVVGEKTEGQSFDAAELGKPVFRAELMPRQAGSVIAEEDVVAFAGIGRPEKFFNSLRHAGCHLIKSFSYADHHVYKKEEIMKMVELASANGAALVTTRKDFVRLEDDAKMMVTVFDVELNFEAPEKLQAMLSSLVQSEIVHGE
ncbi:MAG: tetraacyldisaccharide 4'-kinase [Proteobacteria bacterium]|nr:tetraacyldisaccharide 4'-kinase [Pseudomonadota bacterium]